jgi:ankyrin repeat protein
MNMVQQASRPEWDRILSASQKNNAKLIKYLITVEKVSPNHSNTVGQTSLHVASLWGNVEAVEMLLYYGADVNAQNRINGATPLHSAVQSMKKPIGNRTKCIQLILDSGADDSTTGGTTGGPIKCNPLLTDFFGLTAYDTLLAMVKSEYMEKCNEDDYKEYDNMAKVLSCANETLTSNRHEIFTIIDECEDDDSIDKLKQLFTLDSHTGDQEDDQDNLEDEIVHVIDLKSGLTPLLYTIEKILNYDNDNGSDDDSNDNDSNSNSNKKNNKVRKMYYMKQVICILLEYGADMDANDESTSTGTSMIPGVANAIGTKEVKDLFHELCKMLSNIYARTNNDMDMETDDTNNDQQIKKYLEEIIIALLSNGGSSIKISPSTTSILHDAARRGYIQTIRFWTEVLKVDINLKGRQGLTPLHFAARSGRVDVVKYILSLADGGGGDGVTCLVDVSILDARGKTALDAAIVNDKEEVVKLLQEFNN